MSRYAPLRSSSDAPPSPTSPSAQRRPSFAFRRTHSSQSSLAIPIPDPEEMEAAFADDSGSEDEDGGLLGRGKRETAAGRGVFEGQGAQQGGYDMNGDVFAADRGSGGDAYLFDAEDALPPIPTSSPPPFQPYSRHHPAEGNTNGLPITSSHIINPHAPSRARALIGSLLPSFHSSTRPQRVVGGGAETGVFANLAARPERGIRAPREGEEEGPEWVPEDSQKEGPPSYNAALRDAVPAYWETTVVLPSSSSPFGTLSSSMTGDEILIDGMPVGNFFAFAWNMLVSVSFQFIGFLLTYVLHTSHASKHGSRAGLGITLIQYGLYLRSRAEEMITTGKFPVDPSDPDPSLDDATKFWGPNWHSIAHISPIDGSEVPAFDSPQEAQTWAGEHNTTLSAMMGIPTAAEVGRANEWLSFVLMAVGWFLLLTSVGGYWRVKRFENSLRASQNTSSEPDPALELPNEPTTSGSITTATATQPQFYIDHSRRLMRSAREMAQQARRQVFARQGEGHGDAADFELLEREGEEGDAGGVTGYPGIGGTGSERRGLWH